MKQGLCHFKKKFLFVMILLIGTNIYAQDSFSKNKNAEKHICIGIRYGIGLNSLNSNNTGTTLASSLVSVLNFVLVFESDITHSFSIQPEMQYVQKGFSATNLGSMTIDTKLSYVGLNLLPKIK